MATAAATSSGISVKSRKPASGAGMVRGSDPMIDTSALAHQVTAVAAMTARSGVGIWECRREPRRIAAATPRATAGGAQFGSAANAVSDSFAPLRRWAFCAGRPRAGGSCWTAITIATPAVKPSTTGTGTYAGVAARAGEREGDEHEPGHDAHEHHPGVAVGGRERHEDHGHGAGGRR